MVRLDPATWESNPRCHSDSVGDVVEERFLGNEVLDALRLGVPSKGRCHMATKKKTEEQLLAAAAREQRFPMASVAEWRELVGDTSNALTISLPSRGSSRGSPKGSKSGSRRPRGSGDGKKEEPNG